MKAPQDSPKGPWSRSGPGGTPGWVGIAIFIALLVLVGWVLTALFK